MQIRVAKAACNKGLVGDTKELRGMTVKGRRRRSGIYPELPQGSESKEERVCGCFRYYLREVGRPLDKQNKEMSKGKR